MKTSKIIPLLIIIILAIAVILALGNKDSLRKKQVEVTQATETSSTESKKNNIKKGSSEFVAGTINSEKSFITWTGRGLGKMHTGTVNIASGYVDKKGTGEVIIDMTSITGDESDGVLNHLRGSDFFEVETYPTAKLVINSFDGMLLEGDLTIKDQTNPISLGMNGTDELLGSTIIDRTHWGITYNSKTFFESIGDAAINDIIEISFVIVLK